MRASNTGQRRRRKLVEELLQRDGFVCSYCGEFNALPFNGEATHIDHRFPLSAGGDNEAENLQLLHSHCNLTKRDAMPDAT